MDGGSRVQTLLKANLRENKIIIQFTVARLRRIMLEEYGYEKMENKSFGQNRMGVFF
jgi:hypothetical protein